MRAVRFIAVVGGLALACAGAVTSAAETQAASAAEPQIAVETLSGRQFRGAMDESSTAEQLVVRTEYPGITLRRSIRWERVTGVSVDGRPTEVTELRGRAGKGAGDRGRRSPVRRIEMRGEAPANVTAVEELPLPSKVAIVALDAGIANWDGDVETDGVIVDVAPLDIDRRLVPVNGTLEVELFAQQRRKLELAPQSGGETLELVERWTRAITPEDFGPSGVRLRLPFGAITPELQPNWTAWHYGMVHLRLAVPGHGVFEDTRDGVRIRPWAPNRDRLEMKTGQRFLSTEQLGRRE